MCVVKIDAKPSTRRVRRKFCQIYPSEGLAALRTWTALPRKQMFCGKKINKLSNKQLETKKVTLKKLLSMLKKSRMQEKLFQVVL